MSLIGVRVAYGSVSFIKNSLSFRLIGNSKISNAKSIHLNTNRNYRKIETTLENKSIYVKNEEIRISGLTNHKHSSMMFIYKPL